MLVNKVKRALREGKVQLGTSYGLLRSSDVARVLAAAGFDWAFIDTEHGGFGIETIQDVCRSANVSGLCPIVRVADLQYSLIARALDCGGQGVIFPRVESVELLEKAVSWTKFPPEGIRGFGLAPLQVDFEAVSIPQISEHMNANIMVVLQIETKKAVEMRDELLAVPGIDAVMVGPDRKSVV
jgi:2-keto-3-deoxy-L-rhamnonate aldolase RhmA